MATMRLVPSAVNNAASSYLTIEDQSNMYTNTDSTTYATITNTNASTSSRYIYLKNFNFDDVPQDAEVSSFTVKLKGYYTGGSQQTLYLCNGTTTQSGATATGLTTTTQTRTFNNGSLTWDTISNWGDDFSIRINCRRGSRNTTGYYYIYGAEIEVTYTVPVYHTVSSSTTTGTIVPSGTTSIEEGQDYTLTISGVSSKPVVKDNNVDVSSQLVQVTTGTGILIPQDYTSSGFTWSNITNAYDDASSTTYASGNLTGRTTGTVYFDLGGAVIPSGATIQSVSCQATLQFNANGSSSSATSSFQLYTGSTAKGSSYQWVSSGSNVAKNTYTVTTGTWTASEIADAKFYITTYNGASSTQRQVYVYGISFSVTYEVSGLVYIYTISNVTADHIIVVSAGSTPTDTLYLKINGNWIEVSQVYIKTNGSWVKQTNLTNIFDPDIKYIKKN